MAWAPLEKLKFDRALEDQFWKQKIWESIKNETDVKTLKECIQLLLEIVVTKQAIIKGFVQFNIEQDAAHMKTDMITNNHVDFIKEMCQEDIPEQ